jgi:hypothetical protein
MHRHPPQVRAQVKLGKQDFYVSIDKDLTYGVPRRTDRIPTSLAIERAGAQHRLLGAHNRETDGARYNDDLEALICRVPSGTANWTSDRVEIKYSTVSGKYVHLHRHLAKWWQFSAFPGIPRGLHLDRATTRVLEVEIPPDGWVVPVEGRVFNEVGVPFKTVRRQSIAAKLWNSHCKKWDEPNAMPYFYTLQIARGTNYVISMHGYGCGLFSTEIVSPGAFRPSVGYRNMTIENMLSRQK